MTTASARLRNGSPPVAWLLRSRFDGALFDLDGVLTDTARLHLAAWRQMFAAWAADAAQISDEEYQVYIDGRPREEGLRAFLDARGIDLTDDMVNRLAAHKDACFRALLDERGPDIIESSVDLLRRVRDARMKTAVVTASRNAGLVLDRAGLTEMVDALVDGRLAGALHLRGKPDPASFLEAAHRIGCTPRRCIVIEDSVAGVSAGRQGRFGLVVGLDRFGRQPGRLKAAGADLVVSDLTAVHVQVDRR